ncbi:MAG: ABC transporter ATP-binding protein [Rhodobacter sp.]|nr:ABC transporter ATP-binding protein [Rhodobacter sp.]
MNLLDVHRITAAYGHVQVLFGVDLSVGEAEVVALMGRNGMGKTTTIRCICRMLAVASGEITFAGHRLGRLRPHLAARLGIGLVPEGRRIFPNLTVLENLAVAARGEAWKVPDIFDFFPALEAREGQMGATLSGGEQQMLAIGRALMTSPRLLVLDEATEGLAPVVRAQIWQAVQRLKAGGLSILLIDKSLTEMRAVMDRAVILERGQTVWQGTPGDITADVAERYLGV